MIPREVEVNQSALIRPGEIWKQLRKTIRELPLKKAIKKKVLLENVRI